MPPSLEFGRQSTVEDDGSGGEGLGERGLHGLIKPRCVAARPSPSVGRVTTTDPTGTTTWRDPAWRTAALDWAREQLDEDLVGRPEQRHVMPWSTAIRLPVRGGAVWLKAVGSGAGHEPALAAALGTWSPDHVLGPLAVDAERRLMLLPDGGATLREVGGAVFPEAWEAMLRDYARLQRELVPHAAEMLALGVPDARPDRLPEQVT